MAFPTAKQPAKSKPAKDERTAQQDQERAEQLYNELKPEAQREYVEYFSARTPVELRDEMSALIEADLAEPPTDSQTTTLRHGDSVRVVAAGGGDAPGSPGSAAVMNSSLDFVQLQPVGGDATSNPQR